MQNWRSALNQPYPTSVKDLDRLASQGAGKPLFLRLRIGVATLFVLTVVLTICIPVWLSWNDYHTTVAESEQHNSSLALSLNEHLARTLVSVEQVMLTFSEDLDRAGGIDNLDEQWAHQRMATLTKSTPQIRSITMSDSNGVIQAHGVEYPARHVDVSDRAYFRYHAENTNSRLRIGEPIVSRLDQKWLIPLTRRINKIDGSFGGVLLSSIAPEYFLNFYQSLRLAPGTQIQLFRQDGVLLLSYPANLAVLGSRPGDINPELTAQLTQSGSRTFQTTGSDGRERFVAQLSQGAAPVVIRISATADSVLSKFRRDTLIRAATALGALLLIATLFFLLLKQIRRVEAYEAELRRHRDKLQSRLEEQYSETTTVFKACPLAIAVIAHDHFRFVNPAFEMLFGYESEAIVRQHENLTHGSSREQVDFRAAMYQKLLEGETFEGEIQFFRSNGSSFWARVFARAIWPAEPDRGIVQVIEDISLQREVAQSLRKSERLKRSILDNSVDAFALIDSRRRLVDMNPAFCKQTGFTRESLLGRNPDEIWGAEAAEMFPQFPTEHQTEQSSEISLSRPDGTSKPFLATTGTVRDEYGNIDYSFVFLLEISHQKEIEQSLRLAKTAAETANAAKSTFLAKASHELRTPMHAILSFSEMGARKAVDGSSDSLRHYFQRIQTSGQRLLALINDLLDMSRLESKHMSYHMNFLFLRNTLDEALRAAEPLLKSKGLHVEISGAKEGILLEYDNQRIVQVLANLLANAIKHSSSGETIDIKLIRDTVLPSGRPAAGLSIRNRGPNIPEKELAGIFEVFQDSGDISAVGTGLGLAISRRILTDHQGEIRARNHPEGGAEFTMLLPAKQLHAANDENGNRGKEGVPPDDDIHPVI